MEGAKRQGGWTTEGGGMKMIKCVKKTCSTNFHNTIFSQYTPKGIWDAIVKKPKCFEMFYYHLHVFVLICINVSRLDKRIRFSDESEYILKLLFYTLPVHKFILAINV